jgi:hypothetical protein
MDSVLERANTRRCLRHGVDLPCSIVCEKDFRLASLRAMDLSPDGMRVELRDVDVEAGDRLFVCFRTKPDGRWFFTDAFAVRLLRGRRPGEKGPSLGLRFGSLSRTSRRCVEADLHGMPPLLPQREPRIDYAATIARIAAGPRE